MIDSSREIHLRGLEGIVCGEMNGQKEDTALERAVTLHSRLVPSWWFLDCGGENLLDP